MAGGSKQKTPSSTIRKNGVASALVSAVYHEFFRIWKDSYVVGYWILASLSII